MHGAHSMSNKPRARWERNRSSDTLPVTETDLPHRHSETTIAAQDLERLDELPAEAPNGGYGWICVTCCFWINAHTWGVKSSILLLCPGLTDGLSI